MSKTHKQVDVDARTDQSVQRITCLLSGHPVGRFKTQQSCHEVSELRVRMWQYLVPGSSGKLSPQFKGGDFKGPGFGPGLLGGRAECLDDAEYQAQLVAVFVGGPRFERRAGRAGNCLGEHHARCPHIYGFGVGFVCKEDFWGAIWPGADVEDLVGMWLRVAGQAGMPGCAKVGEESWSRGRVKEDGRGLDVAMEDAVLVDEGQGVEDVCKDARCVARGEGGWTLRKERVQSERTVGKYENEARLLVPERGDETNDAVRWRLKGV